MLNPSAPFLERKILNQATTGAHSVKQNILRKKIMYYCSLIRTFCIHLIQLYSGFKTKKLKGAPVKQKIILLIFVLTLLGSHKTTFGCLDELLKQIFAKERNLIEKHCGDTKKSIKKVKNKKSNITKKRNRSQQKLIK